MDAIVALAQSAYRGDSSRAGWTTEADLLDGIRTDDAAVAGMIADPAAAVLVADGQDPPTGAPAAAAGLLACCHLVDLGAATTSFGLFAVDPTRQGRGTGRAVVEVAAAEAVDRFGAARLRITVIAQRLDLIAWYRRIGFVATGESEPFPYGDERFGVPRRPDLRFEVLVRPLPAGAAIPGRERRRDV